MMKIRMGLMGLIAFLGSCGKPAAEKVAVPMETSPMFGKLETKAEKAELVVKLVNLQGRSRPATLDEISESVRDKYDERYEAEGIDNE